MYFFDLDETIIVKYEVKLNIDKLKKLKKEIINNCSMIEHKSYETIKRGIADTKAITEQMSEQRKTNTQTLEDMKAEIKTKGWG